MNSQNPPTFDDVRREGSELRWEVGGDSMELAKQVLDIEEQTVETKKQYDALAKKIGHAVIKGEQPDPVDLSNAQELWDTLKRLLMQHTRQIY